MRKRTSRIGEGGRCERRFFGKLPSRGILTGRIVKKVWRDLNLRGGRAASTRAIRDSRKDIVKSSGVSRAVRRKHLVRSFTIYKIAGRFSFSSVMWTGIRVLPERKRDPQNGIWILARSREETLKASTIRLWYAGIYGGLVHVSPLYICVFTRGINQRRTRLHLPRASVLQNYVKQADPGEFEDSTRRREIRYTDEFR